MKAKLSSQFSQHTSSILYPQSNTVYKLTSYYIKIRFNIILPFIPISTNNFFPACFLTKSLYLTFSHSCYMSNPPRSEQCSYYAVSSKVKKIEKYRDVLISIEAAGKLMVWQSDITHYPSPCNQSSVPACERYCSPHECQLCQWHQQEDRVSVRSFNHKLNSHAQGKKTAYWDRVFSIKFSIKYVNLQTRQAMYV